MTTFVLVSGAWHAGWCWERVVPLLEAAGHRAVAPDLAGMGPDRTPLSAVTLARWADQIADIIREQPGQVVLAGHSRGGIVISEAAERVPGRIGTLIYLAAFLVPNGETLLATAAKVRRKDAAERMVLNGDGTSTVHPAALGPVFYNMTAPEWLDRARERVSPEPMIGFTTPLRLTEERFGSVKRAYIRCTADNAVPLALQDSMVEALPCHPVLTLETDHSPFYSAPSELVACLLRASAGQA